MTLGQQALSGFAWIFASNLGTKGTTLVVGIVLARLLSPEAFGLVAMLYIFFEVSQSFVDSGFAQALIREKEISEADKSTTFYINVFVSIVFYGLLWIAAPYIADFYNQPILISLTRFMGLSVLIQAFAIIQGAILVQELRFKTLSIIDISCNVITGIVAIILAYMGYGVWALATKYVLTTALRTITFWAINWWTPSHFIVKDSFNRLFGFGSKLFASGLLDRVYQNIYKLIIGKFFSASILGFFTQAQMYVNQVSQGAVGTLQKVTYPILSKAKDDPQRLRLAYRKIILASSFVIFPIVIGLGLIAKPMIFTLVGAKWLPAVPFIQVLCAAGALYHLHSVNLNLLKVVGRSDLFLKLEVIKKVNITVAIILGIQFGIWGLLIGKVISSYIALYINMYYTKGFIDYPFSKQIGDLMPIVLHTLPMAVVVYVVVNVFEWSSFLTLVFGMLIGILSYLITTFVFKSQALFYIHELLSQRIPVLKRVKI